MVRKHRGVHRRKTLLFERLEARLCLDAAMIIDDSDLGFIAGSQWGVEGQVSSVNAQHRTSAPYLPQSLATWTFVDLEPGLYRVFATWPNSPHNAAFDVPYEIVDGESSVGTFMINQRAYTTSFSLGGVDWQPITDAISVFSNRLSIIVSNQAQGTTVADAVRLEYLGPLPAQPSVQFLPTEHFHLGNQQFRFRTSTYVEPVFLGSSVTRSFTIRNQGTQLLTLDNLSAPTGFTVSQPLSASTLSPGETASFSLSFSADQLGVFEDSALLETSDPTNPVLLIPVIGVVMQGPENLIDIYSLEDAEQHRSALIDLIWSGEGIPDRLPDAVQENIVSPIPELPNLSQVDLLSVNMTDGFTSYVYQYNPTYSNNHLAIYHRGHGDVPADSLTIASYLSLGFTVLDFRMPLFFPNIGPVATHDDMASLKTDQVDPLKYFVEPLVVGLNHVKSTLQLNERIVMTGFSGGGWTTTLYAAIDPRITTSFAVAGSLPRYAQEPTEGDFEQKYQPMLDIANYLEMYVLSAVGAGRLHSQILNQYDPCCFYGNRHVGYEDVVKSRVNLVGPGEFNIYVDSTHTQHTISDHVIETVLNAQLRERSYPLVDGTVLMIQGTSENDDVIIEAGQMTRISLNGSWMTLPASSFQSIVLDSGTGADRVEFRGTSGSDSLVSSDNQHTFSGEGFSISVVNAEFVIVNGNGGNDVASISTLDANASINAQPGSAHQIARNGEISIQNFRSISAEKPSGGLGNGTLGDTPSHDQFRIETERATVASIFGDVTLIGYNTIIADASRGGFDSVEIYDSEGDDVFSGSPHQANVWGENYNVSVSGFRYIRAYAINGGLDKAFFQDSVANDHWGSTPDFAHMYDSLVSYYLFASGFDVVHGSSRNGGQDKADLYDSPGNDVALLGPGHASINTAASTQKVDGFAQVNLHASTGDDRVTLLDSSGHDSFELAPKLSIISFGIGGTSSATGFATQTAFSNNGFDSVIYRDSPLDDVFRAYPKNTALFGTDFSNSAIGFRYNYAYFTAGGNDYAEFYDSPANDNFGSTPTFAHMYDDTVSYYNYATGFDRLKAVATSGGQDIANLFDSSGDDLLTVRTTDTTLQGSTYSVSALGFTSVNVYASGGNDRLNMITTNQASTLVAELNTIELTQAQRRLRVSNFDLAFFSLARSQENVVRIVDNDGGGHLDLSQHTVTFTTSKLRLEAKYAAEVLGVTSVGSTYSVDQFQGQLKLEGPWSSS